MSQQQYVIIGSGFAGIWAIQGIRENDQNGKIIMISKEPNYSRPLISYYLGGKVKNENMVYRGPEYFQKHRVELKVNAEVVGIDTNAKTVSLKSGEKISYTKLLIATGGIPIVPQIDGINSKGVYTFLTMQDADNIKKYVVEKGIKSAVVLGGGLIGLKAAEALMDLGLKISIIELADRILSATFDEKASKIIQGALEDQNCKVYTENTIEKIIPDSDNTIKSVKLKDGTEIPTQLLIVAIGVKPNLEILKGTPIKVEKGIVVNKYMQTSVENVYAAGDVVQFDKWVVAILPLATKQGLIAGINMSGGKKVYQGSMPMNSVELCNIPTISFGLTDPKENKQEYEILEKYRPNEQRYRKIILKDNVIVGVIMVKEIDRAGIYMGLIRDKVDVSNFKENLLKDDFGLISLPKDYRKKHLVKGEVLEI